MNVTAQRLTDWTREHGRTWYDPATRLCVGPRDTLWYAIALLFSTESSEQALGDELLREARSADGTHTPATMLAILLAIPEKISRETTRNLEAQIQRSLPEAAYPHEGTVGTEMAVTRFAAKTVFRWKLK